MAEVVRIVIRLIRSCEYKNIRNIVLREDIDGFELSSTTVKDLMKIILQKLSSGKINPPLPPAFKNFNFDCMKVSSLIFTHEANDDI